MTNAKLRICILAFALSGCSLLFPDDPRLGDEAKDECIIRLTKTFTYEQYRELETSDGQWVPTYTYDITKLDFAAVKALVVEGSDETAGTRLMQQTNQTSTAVEQFKEMDVTPQGAFFLGREPALFRVQGPAQPANTILENGCARQQTNMRLIELDWARPARKPDTDTDTDTDKLPAEENNS